MRWRRVWVDGTAIGGSALRFTRTGLLAALVLLNVVAATTVVGVVRAAEDAELPSAMHGAVETQALTAGNGALALFVDPGTAYAYSTMDRDDYGGGSLSYTMTARGANLNLGTIAYAVIWAAPDCNADGNYGCIASGGEGTPNTGLHEAAGFPLYAEALYPPPPEEDGASREYVYKCIVNKDAPGAAPTGGPANEVCKSSDAVPFSSWAEAPGEELRSTGFSRVGGFATDVLAVGASESHSDVRYVGRGKLQSAGSSAINDIKLLGGQIRIEQSSVAAKVVSGTTGAPERSASCTFTGLTIAGEPVAVNDLSDEGTQALLDEVAAATGYEVKIIPPSPVVLEEGEAGKQVASCSGVKVFLTDLHQGSPVPVCAPEIDPNVPSCVPALGNRIELTFGSISVLQSVNDFASGGLTGAIGALPGGVGQPDYAPATAGLDESASMPSIDVPTDGAVSALPASSGEVATGAPGGVSLGEQQLTSSIGGRNLGAIGALTAAAATALMGVGLLLVGIVNALGNGGRFRFPGFGP
jgi:hypothetical protein